MPTIDQASGRLPSTVMSKTTSGSRPSASISGVPGSPGASSPRTSRPAWSSERPSSLPEQSMPLETTPRSLRRPISKPPGRMAPTGASGTRSPTSKLLAPQTISSGSAPASTVTSRILSAPLMASILRTWATTTSPRPSPTCSIASTTRPRSSSAARSAPTSSGKGAKSRSQLSGARTVVGRCLSVRRCGQVRTARGIGCRSPRRSACRAPRGASGPGGRCRSRRRSPTTRRGRSRPR